MKYPGWAGAVFCAAAAFGAWFMPQAAAQTGSVGQPPISALSVYTKPIGNMSAGEADTHLQRIIANNLGTLERYEREGLCQLFHAFTRTQVRNDTEELLNALATQVNARDPNAGRKAAEDVANYVRRVSELIRQTDCPPEGLFDTQATGVTVGTTVQRRQATNKVQTFGFRVGPIEFFAFSLDNEDTQAAPLVIIPLPAFLFGGNRVDQSVQFSGFRHEAERGDALTPSNGNDLLLPASSGPGVFLPGNGTATDVTDSLINYDEHRFEARYLLQNTLLLNGRRTTSGPKLTTTIGGVVQTGDTDILASGNIPNFGFGPDFGFRYMTDIDMLAYGGTVGGTLDIPVIRTPKKSVRLQLGARADILRQDVDAKDSTFLGGGAGTFLDDTADLKHDDTVVNYRLHGGVSVTPRSGAFTFTAAAFYERAEDSFSVERSGAVGGHARLWREDSETYGGSFKFTFPLGGAANAE